MLHSLSVNIPLRDQCSLSVQFSVQLSILSLSFIVNLPLLINFPSQCLNETDISINSGLVVLIHPSFVFIQTAKVLFQIQERVL